MRDRAGPAYQYAAAVARVIDGDTLVADIDLGLNITARQTLRLLGCNARELAAPGGKEARDNLTALLPAGTAVTVHTVKVDKYGGRYDSAITLPDGTDLVAGLIATNWAAAWDGTGPAPVPPWPRPAT